MQIIQLVSGGNSCISTNQLGPQRLCLPPEPTHLQPMDITHRICPYYRRCWTCCPLFHIISGTSLRERIFHCELQKFIFLILHLSWSCVRKWFNLQTVFHTQMSHGLRSKQCAGHKSLLIIPSENTPLRASMNALAVQTVVEYCWNNVQQQFFIGQQLGKLVKYLIHVSFRTDCVFKEISLIILSLLISNYTTV